MKKINIIKTIGVGLMGLSITTATIASLSSCSGLSVPKAPNEFYWNSTKDYTGAGCTFSYPHDEYIVVNDKSEAYKLITDRNKYPDNYVKWDIIHAFTLGANDKWESFKGWIIDFERTNTTIKYKVDEFESNKSNLAPDNTSCVFVSFLNIFIFVSFLLYVKDTSPFPSSYIFPVIA